ncbi:MAG: pyruvate dehydrogenase complex dihydrolipoamide acetyltransferase [Myxococcaceae bacterium]
MATAIQLPALSPTMTEGKITKWLKKEGDKVSSGEAVAEVETDKSNLEIEAYDDGFLVKILVGEGQTAAVGAPIGFVGEKGEKVSDSAIAKPAGASAAPVAPAPVSAAPVAALAPAAASASSSAAARILQAVPTLQAVPAPVVTLGNGERLRASPLAKRMAKDQGVDLARVEGSGPSGRIVKRDVEAAVGRGGQNGKAGGAALAFRAPTRRTGPAPAPTSTPISTMRKVIAQRMGEVKPGVPHFYLTVDIEMDAAVNVREETKALDLPAKVSVNDFIVKAAGQALLRVPKMNVSFQGDRIIQYATADVGIAVAIEDGLITPVIRDADQKPLTAIAAETKDLAERARRKALKPEEYTGGSITVSNLGMFGIDSFIAVINPPHAAILAVGAVADKAVIRGGQVVARKMMSVTLSGDHRAIDGALGAQYLKELKELLEHPLRLLLS